MTDWEWLDEIEKRLNYGSNNNYAAKIDSNNIASAPEIVKLIETVKVMREALLLVEKTYDDDCKDQIVKKCFERCK